MCKREDLSLLDMHDMLDETYTSVESVDHVSQKKTIIKVLNRADVQLLVMPDKSTRKQPQVNVLSRYVHQDTDSNGKLLMSNYISIYVTCITFIIMYNMLLSFTL